MDLPWHTVVAYGVRPHRPLSRHTCPNGLLALLRSKPPDVMQCCGAHMAPCDPPHLQSVAALAVVVDVVHQIHRGTTRAGCPGSGRRPVRAGRASLLARKLRAASCRACRPWWPDSASLLCVKPQPRRQQPSHCMNKLARKRGRCSCLPTRGVAGAEVLWCKTGMRGSLTFTFCARFRMKHHADTRGY